MIFNGFSIDNIWALKRHFSIKNLIEAVDNSLVLANWFSVILNSGTLDSNQTDIIYKIQKNFDNLVNDTDKSVSWEEINGISPANAELTQKMRIWEKKVQKKRKAQYSNFVALILRFLEISDYTISFNSEDEEIIFNYLVDEAYIKTPTLELKPKGKGKAELYYGEKLIAEMDSDQTVRCPENTVFVALHPDTGYIGIDKAGKIINGSAFHIQEIEQKAVKAVISQVGYAILTENGKIVHNLKFSDIPAAPVKNIELYGEQLIWQSMDV